MISAVYQVIMQFLTAPFKSWLWLLLSTYHITTIMDENSKLLQHLLNNTNNTQEKKYKKSKQAFDEGYMQACKDFRKKIAVFEAQFVYLDGSVLTSYDDEKFSPRSFTLYSLVQRHFAKRKSEKKQGGLELQIWNLSHLSLGTPTQHAVACTFFHILKF